MCLTTQQVTTKKEAVKQLFKYEDFSVLLVTKIIHTFKKFHQ